jgi:ABC-type lipoprotein export system ATPase subunit
VNDPDIIFADEPTGNLDSKSGHQVMKILQDLNDQGHTIILVTHERSTAFTSKSTQKGNIGFIDFFYIPLIELYVQKELRVYF